VLAPENPEVYIAEGYAYEIQPSFDTALVSYNKAIEIDASNVSAYVGLGHTYSLMGDMDAAWDNFQKAAELDTENKIGKIYTNLCRMGASRFTDLEDTFTNCELATDESNNPAARSEAYQILAMFDTAIGAYERAESYLSEAELLTPLDPNLYVTHARLQVAQNNPEAAETTARRAIELAPTKAVAHLTLSYALKHLERYDEATQANETALSLVDNDVSLLAGNKDQTRKNIYYNYADIYRLLGDVENEQKYVNMAEALMTPEEKERMEILEGQGTARE